MMVASKTTKVLIGVVLVLMVFLFVNAFNSSGRDVLLPYEDYYMNEDGELIVLTVYPSGYLGRAGDDSEDAYVNPLVGEELTIQFNDDFSKPKQSFLSWLSDITGLFAFKSGDQFAADDSVSSGRFEVRSDWGPTQLIDGKSFSGSGVVVGHYCNVGDYINMYEVEKNFWGKWVRQDNLFNALYKKEYSADGINTDHTYLGINKWNGYYHYECLKPLFFEDFAYKCNQILSNSAIVNFETPYWFSSSINSVACPSGECAPNPSSSFFPKVYRSSTQPTNTVLIQELCVEDQSHCGSENVGSWTIISSPKDSNARWEERKTTGYSALPACSPYERSIFRTTCLSGYHISTGVTSAEGKKTCVPIVTSCPPDSSTSWRDDSSKAVNGGKVQSQVITTYSSFPDCVKSEEIVYQTVCDPGLVIEGTTKSKTSGVKDCEVPTQPKEEDEEVSGYVFVEDTSGEGNHVCRPTTYDSNEQKPDNFYSTLTACEANFDVEGEKTMYTLASPPVSCAPVVVDADTQESNMLFNTLAECQENIAPPSNATLISGYQIVTNTNDVNFCVESGYYSTQEEPELFYSTKDACESKLDELLEEDDENNFDVKTLLIIALLLLIAYFIYDEVIREGNRGRRPKRKTSKKRSV